MYVLLLLCLCVGGLKGDVLVVSGQVKGKTLLPMTPQAELAAQAVSLEEGCVITCLIQKPLLMLKVYVPYCYYCRRVLILAIS